MTENDVLRSDRGWSWLRFCAFWKNKLDEREPWRTFRCEYFQMLEHTPKPETYGPWAGSGPRGSGSALSDHFFFPEEKYTNILIQNGLLLVCLMGALFRCHALTLEWHWLNDTCGKSLGKIPLYKYLDSKSRKVDMECEFLIFEFHLVSQLLLPSKIQCELWVCVWWVGCIYKTIVDTG